MELPSTMDKKPQLRSTPLASKNTQDPSKTGFEYPTKKNGVQYAKKRENDKIESKKSSNRGGRTCQRHVRPREKVGSQVEPRGSAPEFGSLQKCGGKKQNITHLLNWWGTGPDRHSRRFMKEYNHGYKTKKPSAQCMKYSKEHYLHANCQFIVAVGHDYTLYETDPDHLIDWELVEEVRLHMTEAPACPICLHPPVAAKVTRCGHIYCFACVLHYLALTDEKWRKCPICFDVITLEDLKSVTYILHKEFSSNQEIELKLMRRDRESLVPVPVTFESSSSSPNAYPTLSNPDERLSYSKFIMASKHEVSKFIVGREIESLECQLAIEGDEPEACFIKDALILASERDSLLKLKSETFLSSEASSSLPFDCVPPLNAEASLCQSFDAMLVKAAYEDKDNLADESCNVGIIREEKNVHSGITANISEHLDISELQESAMIAEEDVKGVPKSVFYFYQESSGAHIYLHALNVHMLVKEFGCLQNCPPTIKAKVLEKESESMTASLRQRLRYLRHLPLSCPFEVVEVEMKPPLLSLLTIAEFQAQLEQRERKRKKRAKEEYRIQMRVQVQEDKLMGRSKGARINMTSLKHFPSFTENSPPNVVHEDEVWITRPVASTQDEFPNLTPPSFAQMIRCGQKKNENSNFANKQSPARSCNLPSNPAKESLYREECSEDEFDEGERVPDFNAAFSDDFARALDQATQQLSNQAAAQENGQRGKRGKRKKGIVLLSSGGR